MSDLPEERLGFWSSFWEWIKDLFAEEYELTIWFHSETEVTDRGTKTVKRSTPKVFKLKRITTLTQKKVIGKDLHNNNVRIIVTEPFDYNLRKLK